MALAFRFILFPFGHLLEHLDFLAGFVCFPHAPVNLCQAVMSLIGKHGVPNRFLKRHDRSGKILVVRKENTKLQVRISEMGIESDGSFEFGFRRRRILRAPILLGERDSV